MFVCICNAITDHDIKETIAAGATTMSDLQAQLGGDLLRLLRRIGSVILTASSPKYRDCRYQRSVLILECT